MSKNTVNNFSVLGLGNHMFQIIIIIPTEGQAGFYHVSGMRLGHSSLGWRVLQKMVTCFY